MKQEASSRTEQWSEIPEHTHENIPTYVLSQESLEFMLKNETLRTQEFIENKASGSPFKVIKSDGRNGAS